MRRFFEATDVSITAHTETGWSRQSVLLKGGVAIKSFGQDSAVPYPNVAACKDAIQTFRNEVRDAILAVVEAPVKKVEVQTPKEEVTATVNLAAAAPGAADIDDLDALLDDVQDADMGA
jgi:hypothetical protein